MNGSDKLKALAPNEDLSRLRLRHLAVIPVVALLFFYFPCLSGHGDFYYSDLTYYFEPFCHFTRNELLAGRLPLWNPYMFCGMSQIAMPNPSLLYPPSLLLYLLPFSAGLSLYMILHQLVAGLGSYLYLRISNFSRAASAFGATALMLCAYNFSFVRNFTLPASVAWLPLALYFTKKIESTKGVPELKHAAGLAFVASMIVHLCRPEVGLPTLLMIGMSCFLRPLMILLDLDKSGDACNSAPDKNAGQATSAQPEAGKTDPSTKVSSQKLSKKEKLRLILPNFLWLLSCLALGAALSMPSVIPGIEWTALSPRAAGLAQKHVFIWSSNWYDFLGLILAHPLGDMGKLDETTRLMRGMVLSRPGYIPFLDSAYISAIVATSSIWGIYAAPHRRRYFVLALLVASIIVTAGSYTPIAPKLVSLSSTFAAFRYPVKLLIFPCIFLIYFAVQGVDAMLAKEIPKKLIVASTLLWCPFLLAGIAFCLFPQIGQTASNWKWLFQVLVLPAVLAGAQIKMGINMIYAASLGLITCGIAFSRLKDKLGVISCSYTLVFILVVTLLHNALIDRKIASGNYFEMKSPIAEKIIELQNQNRDLIQQGQLPYRLLNLYYDPLSVPKDLKLAASSDQTFFQYARQLVLYESVLCSPLVTFKGITTTGVSSSGGYEAAETADYKRCFDRAIGACSQFKRPKGWKAKITDAPLHRFSSLTATAFSTTQVYRTGEPKDLPLLDPKYYKLEDENRRLNYRLYSLKSSRPRVYLTDKLVFVESFADVEKVIHHPDKVVQTDAFDDSPSLSYLLNRDREKFKKEFADILEGAGASATATSKPGSAVLDLDAVQEKLIKTDSDRAQLLVLADHYYPGWDAELDGKGVEILKANIFNQAILVPAGKHEIRLKFWPKSLVYGFASALAALVLFALFYLLASRKRPKTKN